MDARIKRVTSPGSDGAPDGNSWIVGDDEEVIVIDPGTDAGAVLAAVGEREILAVICTHGHASHVAAAVEVAERDESPIALHPRDVLQWRTAKAGDDPEIDMADGGIFEVADVSLEVIHSPGHTPGSVCLFSEELEAVFSGDTLLATGPAPYQNEFPDFPAQLSAIGEHLLTLDAATRVLPGHGDETTVAVALKRFDSWVTAGPVLAGRGDPD